MQDTHVLSSDGCTQKHNNICFFQGYIRVTYQVELRILEGHQGSEKH